MRCCAPSTDAAKSATDARSTMRVVARAVRRNVSDRPTSSKPWTRYPSQPAASVHAALRPQGRALRVPVWIMAVGFRCLLQREIATRWLITIGREICTRVAEPLENTGIMPESLESSIEASLLLFLLHGGQLHTPLRERFPQTVCVATIEEPSSARHLPIPWIALPANDLMSINPFFVRSNLAPIGPFGGERTPRAGVHSAVMMLP